MKTNRSNYSIFAVAGAALLMCSGLTVQAQTVTNPCPNRVIGWNYDNNGTVNPNDLAGLAPATNWNNSWPSNPRFSLPDNTATATTLNLSYGSFNGWSVGGHPGLDSDGTANRELINGYMNSGPAGWGPWTTNTWVTLTNVPYARYDVVVYFNADANGRHCAIDNGTTSYYFSTVGAASRSGSTALFLPTTETNSAVFPVADFAFFPGMTTTNLATFTTSPKSGNDQWMGITGFQVIESSNVYVLYGPSPAAKVVSVGQPASFSVMAGGLNPTYQWRHASTNIPNATNATYTIASTTSGQDGSYDVVLANGFSSMTSAVATLTFYAPKTDTWSGTGSTWDFASLNWTINGGASTTNYADTDNVRFDPLGIAQPIISVDGTFAPSSIVASNASYTFNTFTSGKITGAGSLRLMNNATVFLQMPDNRTGTTVIDSGSVLEENDYGVLPSGAITNNGALVFNTTGVSGGIGTGYPIYGGGHITNLSSAGVVGLSADIQANSVVQSGAGAVLVQGHNNVLTNILVTAGAFQARDDGALGGASATVTGGELTLYFNFNYIGGLLNLAGGTLHGGVSGSQSFGGPVGLTADSTISVDNGSSLTLSNAAGISGAGFALTKTGNGTLVLKGNNNTWSNLALSAGTVAFSSAANLSVTSSVSGIGNIAQTGSGTTTLSGDNSAMSGNLSVSAGKLLVNTSSGALLADVTGGTLGGTGTIAGSVSIQAGGTLSPGASVGTLTVGGDLTLGGNMLVEVNKSLAPSLTNDYVVVTGTLSNTNNGVVTISNLGPALVAGDSFKLFSQPVTGGETLSITSPGVTWTNKLAADGTIAVLSVATTIPTYPTNITFSASGGTLSLAWPSTHLGWILQSQTNAASTGLSSNWTDVTGSAGMTATNLPVGTSPTVFFRLRYP